MLPDCPGPLNEHVLEEIFSVVHDAGSSSTIQSLLLTSRLFHALAHPLLYRRIGINMASDSFMSEIKPWLTDPEKSVIPRAIRHLHIYYNPDAAKGDLNNLSIRTIGEHPRKPAFDNRLVHLGYLSYFRDMRARDKSLEWSTIASLISQTTQLRSVTFSYHQAMPLVLLQSIHNYPTMIHLNITSWTRLSPDASHNSDPVELALVGSKSLRSLHARIWNPEHNAKDLRLPAFWRLVRSAPNLRSVGLHISYGGCVINHDSLEQIQEWRTLATEFERTTLSHDDLPSGIRYLRITGTDLSQLKNRELSRLTTLDCAMHLQPQILSSLTSLAHLTLRGYSSKPIDDLLIASPPLTSLRIIGLAKHLQLDTILTHHQHSLRALALHEFERTEAADPREVTLIDELFRIRDGLDLEELSMDLNIPEDPLPATSELTTSIHREVYDTLSGFSSLRRVQLNFNLGIASYNKAGPPTSDKPRQLVPLVDERFVREVWAALNLRRTMAELRVAQGESQRETGNGYPASWVLWEQRSHFWLKATPSERDDEPEKITIARSGGSPDFADDLWRE